MVKYKYDAWGNHEAEVAAEGYVALAEINPFRYRGYYYDTETGLYYLQTRYYDPEVGRFISRDSIEYATPETINGLNLYAYCGNNPVNYLDPNGNAEWWQWLIFGIGVALIATGAVIVVDTIVETVILMTSEQYKIKNITQIDNEGNIGGVHINNSAAFNNPIAQYVYSNYLYNNVKNSDGTKYFTGDVYDIIGEWQAHNLAAHVTGLGLILTAIPSGLFGSGNIFSGLYDLHRRSVHVDLGSELKSEYRLVVRGVSQIYKWLNKIISLNILNWW